MQLTINLQDLTAKTRMELFALLSLTTDIKVANEPTQLTLPFDGEIDTSLQPKVSLEKKPRTKRTETASEATETPKEVSEPTPKVKTSTIALSDLKTLAQGLVAKHDRESVKAIINMFGDKLTEVKEEDYQKLFDALNALGE